MGNLEGSKTLETSFAFLVLDDDEGAAILVENQTHLADDTKLLLKTFRFLCVLLLTHTQQTPPTCSIRQVEALLQAI